MGRQLPREIQKGKTAKKSHSREFLAKQGMPRRGGEGEISAGAELKTESGEKHVSAGEIYGLLPLQRRATVASSYTRESTERPIVRDKYTVVILCGKRKIDPSTRFRPPSLSP